MDGARGQDFRCIEPPRPMNAPVTNRSWGRAIVAFIQASGIHRVFLSPGARSSPVVAALADSGMEYVSHYDERGMAFAALGCALASGEPSVCLTTSGSAVANLLPACVEASQSHVPVIFLTADRPSELRGTGANQTIQQPGIFGGYVRFAVDLPSPEEVTGIDELLEPLREAFKTAIGKCPGPVHVNLQFREPLLGADSPIPELRGLTDHKSSIDEVQLPVDWHSFISAKRGVVVVGRLDASSQREVGSIVALAKGLGWPVIADALSGARHLPGVVRHADWILRRNDVPKPERVLQFGGSLVSKVLGEWISTSCGGVDWVQVSPAGEVWDPWGRNPTRVCAAVSPFCLSVGKTAVPQSKSFWSEAWQQADGAVGNLLAEHLHSNPGLTEPDIARLVGRYANVVFLGNSMPVRDFDSSDFLEREGFRLVFGNRGASGIDGNIATISGIARGCGSPVLALLGDLAVLHDMNSLHLLRGLPVTIVVVNNDGGGIFRFLPLSVGDSQRELLWETPHGMDFEKGASQFGISYSRISCADELEMHLKVGSTWPRLLECRTNRAENYALHQEIASRVLALEMNWVG